MNRLALAAGVPQLALTFGAEQNAIGARLAATGAAITLPGHEADADRIRDAVSALLADPAYAQEALVLAEANRDRPTPADLVGQLESLA